MNEDKTPFELPIKRKARYWYQLLRSDSQLDCLPTFTVGSDHPGAAYETLLGPFHSELDVPFPSLLRWPPDDG
jgi:hypothetical protein